MCVHNMVTTIYWWLYCMRDCVVVSIWLCGFLLSAQRVDQFHIKLFSLWECTKANTVTKDTTLVKCHVRYHIIKIIIKIQCFVSKPYLRYRLHLNTLLNIYTFCMFWLLKLSPALLSEILWDYREGVAALPKEIGPGSVGTNRHYGMQYLNRP